MMDDDDFLLNPDEANEIINDFDKNSIDKLFDEFVTTCPNDKAENNIDGLLNISMSSSSCDITKPGIPNDSELDKSPDIQNNDTSSSSATPTTTINHPKTTTTTDTLNSPQVSESFSKSPLKMGCNINNNDGSTDDQQIEDTSDDAYALRHERGLQDERKKFATYLKFPFSTRSRANRRADSRTNSSGANTPDPSSPATTVPNIGVDQEVSVGLTFFHLLELILIYFSLFRHPQCRRLLKHLLKVLRMNQGRRQVGKNEMRGKGLHLQKEIGRGAARRI